MRELEGTTWIVEMLEGVAIRPGTVVTLSLADGIVSGVAGCNRYRAPCEFRADRVAVGPALSTRRLCQEPEGVMAQEQQFLRALETVEQVRTAGDLLELRTGDGAVAMTLRKVAAAVDASGTQYSE